MIFSKTYFSFEEAGLGYVTIREVDIPEERRSDSRTRQLSALLRVLGDCYRYWPSPYKRMADRHPPWNVAGEIRNSRVKAFAEAIWGTDYSNDLELALQDLARCGHASGVISVEDVRIQLVEPSDLYLRCNNCGRVHLHQGVGRCTRCFQPFDWDSAEKSPVSDLHSRNFLARRVFREEYSGNSTQSSFRLHCEELTGQTEHPEERQRSFKGIFLPLLSRIDEEDTEIGEEADEDELLVLGALNPILKKKDEIDLLTVTTTMEVGIDIGPLQVILQANMPPQRFNYQQRVGRAGRRGQAFSMALTICRTKSHDLYYFRHSKKMTGDTPPTPFLTKRLQNIADRFLLKGWLALAFRKLRNDVRNAGEIYPADLMSPPDIHGEYLPIDTILSEPSWLDQIRSCVEDTLPEAQTLARVLCDTDAIQLTPDTSVAMSAIDEVLQDPRQTGLAHCLAEAGLLPLYGMPTRVRKLYLGLRKHGRQVQWHTVDRDLDLAIYEFAPGSSIVIDKGDHLSIGFTPDLADPISSRDQEIMPFQDDAFSTPFFLLECGACQAWTEIREQGDSEPSDECAACGSKLHLENRHECRVPNAFRTDLPAYPRTRKEDFDSGIRHRSIQAEGRQLNFTPIQSFGPDSNWSLSLSHPTRRLGKTFRLNRGPRLDDGSHFFDVNPGHEVKVYRNSNYTLPLQELSNHPRLSRRIPDRFDPSGPTERFWLAAPKVTDSLYLTQSNVQPALSLHRLPGRLDSTSGHEEATLMQISRWLGVRSAAISASYLIVNRSSLELDIDPEEFDVLEPRLYGRTDRRPLLQIADNLVNGAGFCEFLSAANSTGFPYVAQFISSILTDKGEYPLSEFLKEDHSECNTSCYKCLRRYGNQPFHGLLDWQLGLAFLRAMIDPSFMCGLDGNFDVPELERWNDFATSLADSMVKRFDGDGPVHFSGIAAFRLRFRRRYTPWILVAHPLWDWQDNLEEGTILFEARELAATEAEPLCWDTFNLARRQVFVREKIRNQV
ncbi:MAG: hypothetical protein IPM23_21980 [Candidatus Melainabacteria bacterium]|nr:hypothetical protein [Candidatus Melainabacteria bacterium]